MCVCVCVCVYKQDFASNNLLELKYLKIQPTNCNIICRLQTIHVT